MANRVDQLKMLVKRYEKQAKAQIAAMDQKATPKALQGVRQLRRTLNAQLTRLERTLAARVKKKRR